MVKRAVLLVDGDRIVLVSGLAADVADNGEFATGVLERLVVHERWYFVGGRCS